MKHEIIGGEVWLDERGEAVVVLPDHLHSRALEYEYSLECADPARTSAELVDGRLTITSGAPHLKVAWRLAYRASAPPAREEGASTC